MKHILLVLLAVIFIFVTSTSSVKANSILVIKKVDIHWRDSPGKVNNNIRTMYGNFSSISSMYIDEKSLTVLYDNYLICFDFAPGYNKFSRWVKEDWFISAYYEWQSISKRIDYLEHHKLTKKFRTKYNRLRCDVQPYNSFYCLQTVERVNGRVRVFDVKSKTLIADYQTAPLTKNIYDSPFLLMFRPQAKKIAVNIAVQLDKLPNELADFKASLEKYK